MSAARRVALVLALLLVAGAVGYGLAFLSADLVRPSVADVAATQAPGSGGVASPAATAAPQPSTEPAASGAATPASSGGTAGASSAPAPGASPIVHVIAAGETLTSIAAKYGVSVQALVAANHIANPDSIEAGQRLVIPAP